MTKARRARVRRSGVTFDCDVCGRLLRDCAVHNPPERGGCPVCRGDLRRVGVGNQLMGAATWFRCLAGGRLLMRRRGEIVPTKRRSGFGEFT